MTRSRRAGVVAAAVAMLSVGGAWAAPGALAGTPPTITSLSCHATIQPEYECTVTFGGGTPPVTDHWSSTSYVWAGGDWATATSAHTWGTCSYGSYVTVTVTLTGADGAAASASTRFVCTWQRG